MRILIAADIYYPLVNGCSYFAQRLAAQLQELGHSVIVIAPSERFTYTEQEINGIKVYGVPSIPVFIYPKCRLSFFPFYNKKIEKIIDGFKPDVIHFQFHFGVNRAVLKIAKKKGIPKLGTNHFMPDNMIHHLPFNSIIGQPLRNLVWKDFVNVYEHMDQITIPNKISAAYLKQYFTNPITPISCGIDLTRFKPGQNADSLRAHHGIPNKPVLLYVGRLDKEKNLEFVLESVALALKLVDFHFVIAGMGVQKKSLENLANELNISNSVTFTGFISDENLPLLYCLSDCFIIAGTAELQSIVTMEAMASGLPVLAVDAMALPDLVKTGENGYLFPLGDSAGLAEKIKTIFNDKTLRASMSEKSQHIIADHDIKKVMSQFENLYMQLSNA